MAKGKGGFIGQDGLNAPDSPTSVTASAGTGNITVSWTNPTDVGGSAITGYAISSNPSVPISPPSLITASYTSKSFSLESQGSGDIHYAMTFNSDGTKAYFSGYGAASIFQYSLSTAWDISTTSYDSVSLDTSGQTSSGQSGLVFSPDGSKLYMVSYNTDTVYQYTLTTPFDLSTGSYASKSLDISSQDNNPQDMYIKSDGTKLYVLGDTNNSIFQYTMSTPFDLSTASYDSVSFATTTQQTNPTGLFFSSDGTIMLVCGYTPAQADKYILSTPWVVSSASHDSSYTLSEFSGNYPNAIFAGNDLNNLFVSGGVSGNSIGKVFQYAVGMPTGSPFVYAGLTNGTSYTFNVWAINAFGWSSSSDASNSASPLAPLTGDIGLFWYSNASQNIDYITITSTGNAAEFGDCTAENASYGASVGNSTRAVHAGGTGSATNIMDYVNPVNRANAVDFGDYVYAVNQFSGRANNTRGIFSLAYDADGAGTNNVIAYITMATTGNATDFGDLTTSRYEGPTVGSTTRCVFAKGYNAYNTIDYVAFATTGNATDFGDCQNSDYGAGGVASSTRGVWAGGATDYTMIEYITIASTGNATDFGDLNIGMPGRAAGCDNGTRGVFSGQSFGNAMSYITIASTGNSTDYGDLTESSFSGGAGCSNCSGSLT